MANNVLLNLPTAGGGQTITTVDLSTFTAYPTGGELPASCLYVGPSVGSAPTPLSNANPLPVGGTVASGASDTGNPVKIGGVYRATPPTYSDGQRCDLQTDASGNLKVNLSAGGTNVDTNTGTASAGTLRVVLATDQPSLTNAQPVASGQQVGLAYSGTTALTPKYARIDTAASGDSTIIAAVVGKKITILRWYFQAASAVNAKFTDGAAGTALLPLQTLLASQTVSGSYCPVGHFQGSTNTAFVLNLSGAVQVSGYVVYVEV